MPSEFKNGTSNGPAEQVLAGSADLPATRDRLLQELAQLREQLMAESVRAEKLLQELHQLKSRELPAREQENRDMALINRILRVFATTSDDEMFGQVLDIVLEGLGSSHGVFGYIAEPGHLYCPSLSRMLDECEVAGKCIHYPPEKWKGLWARALLTKRAFYSNKPSRVPAGHLKIRNNLAAPILFKGEVIGLFNLANKKGDYTEEDRVLVDQMADRIAPLLYAWIQKKLREQERTRAEEELRQSEQRVRRKLESVLSPDGDLGLLELADLIDVAAFQKLMGDFYAVAGIPMSIIDVKGRVLVGVGWQDICIRYHRVHPETCRHCLESDSFLAAGLAQGESRLYKCRNSMWDMATPILVAGQHVGSIFTGQFFFDDETVDRDLFRTQARRYGFDEQAYLAALDCVPRLSREKVDSGMGFFVKLADTISQLAYSNIKLARLLHERDMLTASLEESRAKLEAALASMTDAVFISDAQGRLIDFNAAFATFHRFSSKEQCSRFLSDSSEIVDLFLNDGGEVMPDRRPLSRALRGETDANAEYVLRRRDTGEKWFGSYSFGPIRDKAGKIAGAVLVARDITVHKDLEESLRQANKTLEQRVAERTALVEARTRQLQALAVELVEAEERERRQLAHLLHDDLQQMLAAAKMQLQAASDSSSDPAMLKSVGQILEESIAKTRRLSHELSPAVLHYSGLIAGLEWLAEQMHEQFGLEIVLAKRTDLVLESTPLKALLFRAVQELLFNIVKHAGVKEARIDLSRSKNLFVITVSDQGRGFDPHLLGRSKGMPGFGLLTIQERVNFIGGMLAIESAPGQGSRFTLTVPLHLANADDLRVADFQKGVNPQPRADDKHWKAARTR